MKFSDREWEDSYKKQFCDIRTGGNDTPTPFHVLCEVHETNDSRLRSLIPTAGFPSRILTRPVSQRGQAVGGMNVML